jgi:hypothetical protein
MESPKQRTFPGLGINHSLSLGACGQNVEVVMSHYLEGSYCVLDLCKVSIMFQECKLEDSQSPVCEDCR